MTADLMALRELVLWAPERYHAEARERLDRIAAALKDADRQRDREHVVEVFPRDMPALRRWLASPNGALRLCRVTFEAVEHGGILVRTDPFTAPRKDS